MPLSFQTDPPTTSLLTRTKQHCLIGIRGTVRRSTDSWFVHCNVGMYTAISYFSKYLAFLFSARHRRYNMGR